MHSVPKMPADAQDISLASPCTEIAAPFGNVHGALFGHQRGDALTEAAANGGKSLCSP